MQKLISKFESEYMKEKKGISKHGVYDIYNSQSFDVSYYELPDQFEIRFQNIGDSKKILLIDG